MAAVFFVGYRQHLYISPLLGNHCEELSVINIIFIKECTPALAMAIKAKIFSGDGRKTTYLIHRKET
jgi:hypothetical protein